MVKMHDLHIWYRTIVYKSSFMEWLLFLTLSICECKFIEHFFLLTQSITWLWIKLRTSYQICVPAIASSLVLYRSHSCLEDHHVCHFPLFDHRKQQPQCLHSWQSKAYELWQERFCLSLGNPWHPITRDLRSLSKTIKGDIRQAVSDKSRPEQDIHFQHPERS